MLSERSVGRGDTGRGNRLVLACWCGETGTEETLEKSALRSLTSEQLPELNLFGEDASPLWLGTSNRFRCPIPTATRSLLHRP